MSNLPAIHDMEELQRVARMYVASGFFTDVKDIAQAAVKIQAGGEYGFSPIASMTGVYIVKGKVALSAQLMGAAITRAGYTYRVREHTPDICSIEFFDVNKDAVGCSTFSMADARAAGLANGDNWKKFPRNMLFARAMSNGARWYCASAFGGGAVYTPDELEELPEPSVSNSNGQSLIEAKLVNMGKEAASTEAEGQTELAASEVTQADGAQLELVK